MVFKGSSGNSQSFYDVWANDVNTTDIVNCFWPAHARCNVNYKDPLVTDMNLWSKVTKVGITPKHPVKHYHQKGRWV